MLSFKVEVSHVLVLQNVLAVHDVLVGLGDDGNQEVEQDDDQKELVEEPDQGHQVQHVFVGDISSLSPVVDVTD